MTAFTRIIIVLSILRQAWAWDHALQPGADRSRLFMTFFVMGSHARTSYAAASSPYMDGRWPASWPSNARSTPLKKFMLAQTRENDLQLFSKLWAKPQFPARGCADDVLVPLHHQRTENRRSRSAFMIFIPSWSSIGGASVLMSMGMRCSRRCWCRCPFKIMLFVVVDAGLC